MAAVDYFLKLDGIQGESADSKHKNEIDVESWSWGESQGGTMSTGGGGGAGKVQMQDFHFVMKVTKPPRNCCSHARPASTLSQPCLLAARQVKSSRSS